jgi:hypothetical protein
MRTVLTLGLGIGLVACRGPADAPPPAAAPTPAPCARIGETCRYKPGVLGVCEPQGEVGALRCMPQH